MLHLQLIAKLHHVLEDLVQMWVHRLKKNINVYIFLMNVLYVLLKMIKKKLKGSVCTTKYIQTTYKVHIILLIFCCFYYLSIFFGNVLH